MIYYSRLTLLLLLVSTSLLHAMEHDEIDVIPAQNTLLGIPAEVRLIIFDEILQEEFKAQPHILAFFKRLRALRTINITFRAQMLEDNETQSQKFIEACGKQNEPYAQCLKTILSARRNLTPFERLVLSYFSSSTHEIGDSGALMHHALETTDLDVAKAVVPTLTPYDLSLIAEPFSKAAAKADIETTNRLRALRNSITNFDFFPDIPLLEDNQDFYMVFASLLRAASFDLQEATSRLLTIFSLETKDQSFLEKVLSNTPCDLEDEAKSQGPFDARALNICFTHAIQNKNDQLVHDLMNTNKIHYVIALIGCVLCCKQGFLDLFRHIIEFLNLPSHVLENLVPSFISEAVNAEHEAIISYCLMINPSFSNSHKLQEDSLRLCKLCFENNEKELTDFLASKRTVLWFKIVDFAFTYAINKGKKECINALLSYDRLNNHAYALIPHITHAKISNQHEIAHMLMRKYETVKNNEQYYAVAGI